MTRAIVLWFVMFLFVAVSPTVAQQVDFSEYTCGLVELFQQSDGTTRVRCYPPEVVGTATPSPTVTVEPTPTPGGPRRVVVDKTSIELFEQIPDEYLTAARNLRVMFSDRSVGQNINESLGCLTAASYGQSPAFCRRGWVDDTFTSTRLYTATDFANGNVPALLHFLPDTAKYNRSNIIFEARMGTWSELTDDFIHSLAPSYIDRTDVLSYQFSYLNVTAGSDIMQWFEDGPRSDVYDLQRYLYRYPNKHVFFWTSSLARTIGTHEATQFNQAMREYTAANNLPLLDMADIISHRPDGSPCYDPSGRYPVICKDYTTESVGGHLGSVSGGRIRMAKAFWVMLAQLAGWHP